MRKQLSFSLVLAMMLSCAGNDQTSTPKPPVIPPPTTPKVTFSCEKISEDDSQPLSVLYVEIGRNKFKVGEVNACASIEKEAYVDYDIPQDAVAAAGGWWAGFGDYFYAFEREDAVQVLATVVDEMMTDTFYTYVLVGQYENGEFQLSPNKIAYDWSGIYASGSHDKSWVFSIDLVDEKVEAKMFEIDGMLPPRKQLPKYVNRLGPNVLTQFDLNPDNLTFVSNLGKGKFVNNNESTIVFEDLKAFSGDTLKLSPVY